MLVRTLCGIMQSLLVLGTVLFSEMGTFGICYSSPVQTAVGFEPQSLRVFTGQRFTIAVYVGNVSLLYGFDIGITWNTTCLRCLNRTVTVPVEEYLGGLLHEPAFLIVDELNESGVPAAGQETRYWLAAASMVPASPFNGSGTAFTMTFRASNCAGLTTVNFTRIILGDIYAGPPIPCTSFNCTIEIVPSIVGDISYDGIVDIQDIVMATSAYDSREGEPGWVPEADLAPPHGVIDIFDVVTIAYHYGEEYE